MTEVARPAQRSGRIAWQLTMTLWVGGVWMLHFVLLPALQRFGLAPLLVDEIAGFMRPLMAVFAAICAALQLLIVISVLGRTWWKDLRGQLLLLVIAAGALHLTVPVVLSQSQAQYWQMFCYLILAFAGLVLVLQPRPDESGT